VADLVAGVTVGLTLIPQAIAYASLAGLDPQVRIRKKTTNPLAYL
jgi:sodium-independent sulfate anion transporter 11